MAVEFRKPTNGSPSNYLVDPFGKLTGLRVAAGNKVNVLLWKEIGDRASVKEDGTSLVSVWNDPNSPGDGSDLYVVTGSATGSGKLVAYDVFDQSKKATLPFDVSSVDANHNWSAVQPAAQAMWSLIHQNFRRVRFLGILMGPGHEDHSEGRACDLGLLATVPWEASLAGDIIDLLIANADEIGWSYFIWNRQIWTSDPPIAPRAYDGTSPHTEHIHVSWSRANSQRRVFPNFVQAVINLRARIIKRDGGEV